MIHGYAASAPACLVDRVRSAPPRYHANAQTTSQVPRSFQKIGHACFRAVPCAELSAGTGCGILAGRRKFPRAHSRLERCSSRSLSEYHGTSRWSSRKSYICRCPLLGDGHGRVHIAPRLSHAQHGPELPARPCVFPGLLLRKHISGVSAHVHSIERRRAETEALSWTGKPRSHW